MEMAKRDAAYNWYWCKIQLLVTANQCIPQIIDVLAFDTRYILRGLDARITAPYRLEATQYVGTGEDYYICREEKDWVFRQENMQALWDELQGSRKKALLDILDSRPGL